MFYGVGDVVERSVGVGVKSDIIAGVGTLLGVFAFACVI